MFSRFLLLLLLFPLLVSPGSAQDPEPAPTNAARTLTAQGVSRIPTGVPAAEARKMAREAALLQATAALAKEAGAPDVGAVEPRYDVLGWLLQARLVGEEEAAGQVRVHLESPPMSALEAALPAVVGSLEKDADGDGRLETVAAGYDTRIYVIRDGKVQGVTPGLGFLESGPDRVRLTRVLGVEGAEPAGPGKVRVLVRLGAAEALGGLYAGTAEEKREVIVSLAPPGDAPSIEITEPAGEVPATRSRVPLRGRVAAPAGLQEVRLSLNGRDLWHSTSGMKDRELRLDMVLPLQPGPNEAVVSITDRRGRREERRVKVIGPLPSAAGQGRALVVGTDEAAGEDAARVGDALSKGGFAQVQVLTGEGATREAFMAGLQALSAGARPGDRVVLYFAGLASVAEGKHLLAADGEGISGADLGRWARRLPAGRLLVVLDTATDEEASVDTHWLEGSDFLAASAGPGRTFLASGDPAPALRGLVTAALLKTWPAAGDPFTAAVRAYPLVLRATAEAQEKRGEPPLLPLWRGD